MKTGGTSTMKKAFFRCTRFALFLISSRKQAAPQERKTSFLLSIRFALFLYHLKRGVLNRY